MKRRYLDGYGFTVARTQSEQNGLATRSLVMMSHRLSEHGFAKYQPGQGQVAFDDIDLLSNTSVPVSLMTSVEGFEDFEPFDGPERYRLYLLTTLRKEDCLPFTFYSAPRGSVPLQKHT